MVEFKMSLLVLLIALQGSALAICLPDPPYYDGRIPYNGGGIDYYNTGGIRNTYQLNEQGAVVQGGIRGEYNGGVRNTHDLNDLNARERLPQRVYDAGIKNVHEVNEEALQGGIRGINGGIRNIYEASEDALQGGIRGINGGIRNTYDLNGELVQGGIRDVYNGGIRNTYDLNGELVQGGIRDVYNGGIRSTYDLLHGGIRGMYNGGRNVYDQGGYYGPYNYEYRPGMGYQPYYRNPYYSGSCYPEMPQYMNQNGYLNQFSNEMLNNIYSEKYLKYLRKIGSHHGNPDFVGFNGEEIYGKKWDDWKDIYSETYLKYLEHLYGKDFYKKIKFGERIPMQNGGLLGQFTSNFWQTISRPGQVLQGINSHLNGFMNHLTGHNQYYTGYIPYNQYYQRPTYPWNYYYYYYGPQSVGYQRVYEKATQGGNSKHQVPNLEFASRFSNGEEDETDNKEDVVVERGDGKVFSEGQKVVTEGEKVVTEGEKVVKGEIKVEGNAEGAVASEGVAGGDAIVVNRGNDNINGGYLHGIVHGHGEGQSGLIINAEVNDLNKSHLNGKVVIKNDHGKVHAHGSEKIGHKIQAHATGKIVKHGKVVVRKNGAVHTIKNKGHSKHKESHKQKEGHYKHGHTISKEGQIIQGNVHLEQGSQANGGEWQKEWHSEWKNGVQGQGGSETIVKEITETGDPQSLHLTINIPNIATPTVTKTVEVIKNGKEVATGTLIDGKGTIEAGSATSGVKVIGGSGSGYIQGASGSGYIQGGSALDSDYIRGGSGSGFIQGGSGSGFIQGGSSSGSGFIQGGSGSGFIQGGSSLDSGYIQGGSGSGFIQGGSGSGLIQGDLGLDSGYIQGGSGSGFIQGGSGSSFIQGGSGSQSGYIQRGSGSGFIQGGSGFIQGGSGSGFIQGGLDSGYIQGGSGLESGYIERGSGSGYISGGLDSSLSHFESGSSGIKVIGGKGGTAHLEGGSGVSFGLNGKKGGKTVVVEDAGLIGKTVKGTIDGVKDIIVGGKKVVEGGVTVGGSGSYTYEMPDSGFSWGFSSSGSEKGLTSSGEFSSGQETNSGVSYGHILSRNGGVDEKNSEKKDGVTKDAAKKESVKVVEDKSTKKDNSEKTDSTKEEKKPLNLDPVN